MNMASVEAIVELPDAPSVPFEVPAPARAVPKISTFRPKAPTQSVERAVEQSIMGEIKPGAFAPPSDDPSPLAGGVIGVALIGAGIIGTSVGAYFSYIAGREANGRADSTCIGGSCAHASAALFATSGFIAAMGIKVLFSVPSLQTEHANPATYGVKSSVRAGGHGLSIVGAF